jgi:ABC-2 type transport system ATP-binding protein
MFALELAAVSKYFGERAALSQVSLTLAPGSTLGLLGPNGAGKTTALRLILGHTAASEGTVRLQGGDPFRPASRRGVGYLPERLVLPAHRTVASFLRMHGGLAGLRGADLDRGVSEVAEQTGIGSRLGDLLGSLSKGLAQRVGFAQALIADPRLLLLDEPSSGLDPIGMREARDWIARAKARGCSVLVSSHLLSEVERICDSVVILHEGSVVAAGSIGEIVREGEELEDAFMRIVGAGSAPQPGGRGGG